MAEKCSCVPIKLNIIKVIGLGVIFAVVAQIIHYIGTLATMGYYTLPELFSVWSKIMMPAMGPPPIEFLYYSIIFNLITGLLFAGIYKIFGCCVPGKNVLKRGMVYGLGVFLVGAIPGYLAMILLINLPAALIAVWAIEMLVIYLIMGSLVAKLAK